MNTTKVLKKVSFCVLGFQLDLDVTAIRSNLDPDVGAGRLDVVRMVDPRSPDDVLPSVGLGRGVGAESPGRDVAV